MINFFGGREILSPPALNDYKSTSSPRSRMEGGLRTRGMFHKKTEQGKPLVSIITVVRNGEKYLEHTIQNVIHQTYDNIEYIVIDGGSTDGTLDIIRKNDNKVAYWLSEPDEGISDAFNKGISLASGDIIGIINADDWYEVDTVGNVVKRFSECKADVVHGIIIYGDVLIYPDERMLIYEMAINHPTVFVTHRSYLKLGLFRKDFRYAMDYDWILRAKSAGLTFSFIDKCLANMRQGGVSDRQWRMAVQEVLKAQNVHYPDRFLFNYLFFTFQIIKGTFRRLFEKIGLRKVVQLYHSYISIVKKKRVDSRASCNNNDQYIN
ncbi:MAG: glycosyltransferase family 2 protein [Candidatus Loosdrechtia sp.]|uniref:glycosyltransferase family 2 protein n=1 Tax=Candidatus Loosdrechtia sp. TaxID=3101272 RepID=UPI003A79E3C5|nr:MAG: glycosyltransferase family 2 protein [Candidatus Jettenia sp. AMX2]